MSYTANQLAVIRPIIDAMAASTAAMADAKETMTYVDTLRVAIHATVSRDHRATDHVRNAKRFADLSTTTQDEAARTVMVRLSRDFLTRAITIVAGFREEE